MKKEKNNSGMPDSEKEAAIGLLITVFSIHDREKALMKALDDFSDVYGDEVPGWLQHLYDCMKNTENNGNKLDVVRNFAEQHKIELNV